MKTNKEIKPFKMRCENREEFRDVVSILDINGVDCTGLINGDTLIINVYRRLNSLAYITFEKHFNEPEPELTYSEFMKLYGGEEEVFTREDMKEFAVYVASAYSRIYLSEGHRYVYKGRENDWNNSFTTNEILIKFLSERTND